MEAKLEKMIERLAENVLERLLKRMSSSGFPLQLSLPSPPPPLPVVPSHPPASDVVVHDDSQMAMVTPTKGRRKKRGRVQPVASPVVGVAPAPPEPPVPPPTQHVSSQSSLGPQTEVKAVLVSSLSSLSLYSFPVRRNKVRDIQHLYNKHNKVKPDAAAREAFLLFATSYLDQTPKQPETEEDAAKRLRKILQSSTQGAFTSLSLKEIGESRKSCKVVSFASLRTDKHHD